MENEVVETVTDVAETVGEVSNAGSRGSAFGFGVLVGIIGGKLIQFAREAFAKLKAKKAEAASSSNTTDESSNK